MPFKRTLTGKARRDLDKKRKRNLSGIKKQIQDEDTLTAVQYETKCILPDVPNLDIVKKEPLNYTDEILPPSSQNTSPAQNVGSFIVPVKSEPFEDNVDDRMPVNSNDITPLSASNETGESSLKSMLYTCSDNTEPPPKKTNISLSPSSNSANIKDVFSVFGNFVAAKICSFSDQLLQLEVQHQIANVLFELERKDLKNSLHATVTLPPSSNISKNSS